MKVEKGRKMRLIRIKEAFWAKCRRQEDWAESIAGRGPGWGGGPAITGLVRRRQRMVIE